MLSINIFFALVLQTQLLSKVKASHQIDLGYLYYLPFCAVSLRATTSTCR
jgi:hypothetical protein